MSDEMIVGAVGFIGALLGIILSLVRPIIALNTSIAELNTTLSHLRGAFEENISRVDERLTHHGKQIDELKSATIDQEARIKVLEKVGIK